VGVLDKGVGGSQQDGGSPVVSETAGSQRGMRERGKGATAWRCKWLTHCTRNDVIIIQIPTW